MRRGLSAPGDGSRGLPVWAGATIALLAVALLARLAAD